MGLAAVPHSLPQSDMNNSLIQQDSPKASSNPSSGAFQCFQRLKSSSNKVSKTVQPRKHSKKFERTNTGCLTCRRKKKKCDGKRPVCQRCQRLNQACQLPALEFLLCDIKPTTTTTKLNNEKVTENNEFVLHVKPLPLSTNPPNFTFETPEISSSRTSASMPLDELIPATQEVDSYYMNTVPATSIFRSTIPNNQEIFENSFKLNALIQEIKKGSSFSTTTPAKTFHNLEINTTTSQQSPRSRSVQISSLLNDSTTIINNPHDYILDAINTQKVIPKKLLRLFHALSKQFQQTLPYSSSNPSILVYRCLDAWCCQYISRTDHSIGGSSITRKYSQIDFNLKLSNQLLQLPSILTDISPNSDPIYELAIHTLLLLIDDFNKNPTIPTANYSSHPILKTNSLIRIKNWLRAQNGLINILNTSNSNYYTIFQYLLFFELTCSYTCFKSCIFLHEDIMYFFNHENRLKVAAIDDISVIQPVLRIFYQISRLSTMLNNSRNNGDRDHTSQQLTELEIHGIVLEASYLEKKLDNLQISNEKNGNYSKDDHWNRFFNFYKSAGKLFIFQCIYKRQPLSLENLLVIKTLLRQVPNLIDHNNYNHKDGNSQGENGDNQSYYPSLIFPVFLLSINLGDFRDRYWIIHWIRKLYEIIDCNYSGMDNLLDVLKEIWAINGDGLRFVDCIEVIEKKNVSLN